MAREQFYNLYRKLASTRSKPTDAFPVLDELTLLCRDLRSTSASPQEWLAEAGNCLHEIAQSSLLFARAASRWLTNKEDIQLAKVLVHKASVRHLEQVAAEAYDLSIVEEKSAILTGCRLCTLSAAPALTLGWALSLAVSYPTSALAKEAVEYLLRYHAEEFPQSTRRLLSSEESQFKSLASAIAVLAALEEQEAWHENQPRLREFSMTPEMRLSLSSLQRRDNRDIQRHSREKSVFSKIFKAEHFKYANRTAVEFLVGDKVQETTLEMSAYSLSIELPFSELTDPQSGRIRRRRLWKGVPK